MSEKGETGNNNNNNNNTCVVCYKNVEIYSIGMCDHPVCYECSTRMRVLCRQNECPICRQDLPKVVFINIIKPFRNIIKNNLLDTRFNIFFDNTNIQEKFIQLLSHTCQICKYKKLFGSFNGLKDHMRREHDLHYCELCVENLKIFSYERRCYTRSDLALHRRKGDADDKSHKGHPLCEFCECRYMDNDELFRHLRRDHLYCHFCDADGLHQYYDTYDYLRDHFSKEHYLCEEGPCANEKFTSVFRSDIDLKAHKSSVHGKFMGKAAAKQARTLELEFTLAPRGDNNRNNRRGQQSNNNNANPNSSNYNNNNNTNHNNNNNYNNNNNNNNNNNASRNTRDYYDLQDNLPDNDLPSPASMKQPDVKSTQEFPSLGNTASSSSGPVNFSQTKNKGRGGNLTIRGSFGSQKLSMNNENFPALGSDNSGLSNIVNLNLYSSNNNNNNNSNSGNSNSNNSNNNNNKTTSSVIQNSTPNVSIHVNHKTNGSITTKVTRPTVKPVGQSSKKNDDFPALGGNCTSLKNTTHSTTTNTAQWTKVTCVKQPSVAVQKNNKKLNQQLTNLNDSMLSEAFPSLPKTSKDKKQTSISVTTSNTLKNIQKNDVPSSSSSTSSPSIKNTTINDDTNNNSKKKKKKKTKTTSTSNNNSSGNESLTSKTIQKNINDKQQSSDNNNNNTIDNNKNKTNDIVNIKDDSTKNLTRKRSEIKIDNLNNNNVKKNDDFPALGKSSKTSTTLKPPPGFGTLRLQQQQQQQQPAPPPGFPVKLNSIVRPQQQQQQQCNNDLTFTNSSGQSFTILPDKNNKIYTYLPPPDFQQRNKNLVSKISNILELKDAIDEFRLLSGLYRQNMCTAEDYYKRCRMEMGLSEFSIIFPEMLVLLPDINKQRELYYLHKKEINGQVKGLELCTLCGQVCKSESDIVSHLSSHTLENNFPALGAATATATTTTGTTHSFNNNWPRKTA